jgi:hypothetical protein
MGTLGSVKVGWDTRLCLHDLVSCLVPSNEEMEFRVLRNRTLVLHYGQAQLPHTSLEALGCQQTRFFQLAHEV